MQYFIFFFCISNAKCLYCVTSTHGTLVGAWATWAWAPWVSLLFIFKLNLKLLQSNGVDVTSKFNERNATGRFCCFVIAGVAPKALPIGPVYDVAAYTSVYFTLIWNVQNSRIVHFSNHFSSNTMRWYHQLMLSPLRNHSIFQNPLYT